MSLRPKIILSQSVIKAFTVPEDTRVKDLSWEHHRVAFYLASKEVEFNSNDMDGTIEKLGSEP